MKISIANKKLLAKPQTNLEKSQYFKDIEFTTCDISLSQLSKIVKNGFTITYLYNDNQFTRDNHYMKDNYIGTEIIVVDVDSCDIAPQDFLQSIKYKPTVLHTTFSNLTQQKGNKYCFHLIYCFDTIIKNEDNFSTVFNQITEDYQQYVDSCAKDCHRVIFTSNSTLSNFEIYQNNNIYKVSDFLPTSEDEDIDNIDEFISKNRIGKKSKSAYILTSTNNIQAVEKKFPQDKLTKNKPNNWNLDETFWEDLNSMTRSQFLDKYLDIYPYINRSLPTQEQIKTTNNGITYEDWRGIEYYEVPSKYRFINGKHQVVKVPNGNRTKSLMFDALCFIKCIPSITKEYLVTMLINEVYKYYDNNDKELNNYKILGIAKYAWDLKDNININPIKKTFKIQYSMEVSKRKAVGLINKLMKDEEIGNLIDVLSSVEDNLKIMKENGLSITKTRLNQFLNEYQIDLKTNKELRNEKVIELYEKNNHPSSRELEKICKANGIKITYKTIQSIIKEN